MGAWQGRAGGAELQELAEFVSVSPGDEEEAGISQVCHSSVLLCRCIHAALKVSSKCSSPGAKVGKQPETCQGKGSNYFAK